MHCCTVKRHMLFPKRLFIYIDKATAKGWGLRVRAVQMETPLTFRTWMDQCLHVSPFLEVRLNSQTLWKTQLFTFVAKNPTDSCPRAAILYLILNFDEKKPTIILQGLVKKKKPKNLQTQTICKWGKFTPIRVVCVLLDLHRISARYSGRRSHGKKRIFVLSLSNGRGQEWGCQHLRC